MGAAESRALLMGGMKRQRQEDAYEKQRSRWERQQRRAQEEAMEAIRQQQQAFFEVLESSDDESDDDESGCLICGKTGKKMLTCHATSENPHTFCKECLDKELRKNRNNNNKCPKCRQPCLPVETYQAAYPPGPPIPAEMNTLIDEPEFDYEEDWLEENEVLPQLEADQWPLIHVNAAAEGWGWQKVTCPHCDRFQWFLTNKPLSDGMHPAYLPEEDDEDEQGQPWEIRNGQFACAACWTVRKKLEALLYHEDDAERPLIEEVSKLLTEARAAGSPIDLDEYEEFATTYLNSILYNSSYGDISDVPHLKEILSQAKNWDAYFDKDDNTWNSPLIWITWKDDESKGYEMSLALLPFLKEKGYTIDEKERGILPKQVVTVWDAL